MESSKRAGSPGRGASRSLSNAKRSKTNDDDEDSSSVLSVLRVVWLHVYPFLELKYIYRVGLTCKTLNNLTRDEQGKLIVRRASNITLHENGISSAQVLNKIHLEEVEDFYVFTLFNESHSDEQQEEDLEALVSALPHMTGLKILKLRPDGVPPELRSEGGVNAEFNAGNVYERLGTNIALCPNLNVLSLQIDCPNKLLWDAVAYGIKHGRFQELRLQSPIWSEMDDNHTLQDTSDTQAIGDAIVATSRIQTLDIGAGLHLYHLEKIILPALVRYKASGGIPIQSCKEIHLKVEYDEDDYEDGEIDMTADDLANFLDHFASFRFLKKLTLDFVRCTMDPTYFSAALIKLMKNRPFSGELSVFLLTDGGNHFLNVLLKICERQPFATIDYSVEYAPETTTPFEACERLCKLGRKFKFDALDDYWLLRIFPKARENGRTKDPFEAKTIYHIEAGPS